MSAAIERVVTSGVFTLDGQSFDVDNNVWLVGDGDEVLVVDAAHDADAIAAALGGRRVVMIVCTHGHNDHINAAADLATRVDAPVALHRDDRMLWDAVHADRAPDVDLADVASVRVGGTDLQVLATPGHSPGSVCLRHPDGHLFSGDTLFPGGPGRVTNPRDFRQIMDSLENRLFTLPDETRVYPGHGDETTIGNERPHLPAWRARGW